MDDDFKDDHFKDVVDGRPGVPPYRPQARAQARERLLRESRRGSRLPWFGWQAAAAFGVTVTLVGGVAVALTGQGAGPDRTSATSVARQGSPELDPEPGQFILIESDTMYGSTTEKEKGKPIRHLYRTHRKIYQSVDGQAHGLLLVEGLEPKPWPGETLPAKEDLLEPELRSVLAACPALRGDRRDDYSYLSTLPADPERMRERFYRNAPADQDADATAFDEAGELIRETYMPRAQREAVFEAVKAIPGVKEEREVQDSAGRTGVALGRPSNGTLHQLIFDPETHMLLGERGTVVDAKAAGAPEGSVIAHTAELSVTVVDELPKVSGVDGDDSCVPEPDLDDPLPVPSPTATVEPSQTEPPRISPDDAPSDGPSETKPRISPDDAPHDVPSDGRPRTRETEPPVAGSTKAPAVRPADSPAG